MIFFTLKDQNEFNKDLSMFEKLDEKLNMIFSGDSKKQKKEKIIKKKITKDDTHENKIHSFSNRSIFRNFTDVRKRFYSQKSLRL